VYEQDVMVIYVANCCVVYCHEALRSLGLNGTGHDTLHVTSQYFYSMRSCLVPHHVVSLRKCHKYVISTLESKLIPRFPQHPVGGFSGAWGLKKVNT